MANNLKVRQVNESLHEIDKKARIEKGMDGQWYVYRYVEIPHDPKHEFTNDRGQKVSRGVVRGPNGEEIYTTRTYTWDEVSKHQSYNEALNAALAI